MAIRPSQMKAVAKYNAANYDRFELRFPKGRKADAVARAEALDKSLNRYINGLISSDLNITEAEWEKKNGE